MRVRIVWIVASTTILLGSAACAPKTVVTPVVTAPRFPDYVEPTVPVAFAGGRAAVSQQRAWAFLQAGDLRNADREVSEALTATPGFYPAETTGGYIELARRDARAAVARFDGALGRRSDYAPALAGKGEALTALNRENEAIDAFEAALAADRSLTEIQRRLEVLKFRVVQQEVAAARQAARAGRLEEARSGYRVALARSPETAFLYRELAAVERDRGDLEAALEDVRKAVTLDPTDAAAFGLLGDILVTREDIDGALRAYASALTIEPDAAIEAKRDQLQVRAEASTFPAEYRAIEEAPQISRADLAALVAVRLTTLLQGMQARDVGVITDIRRHWAEQWILAVTRAGVIDPFENHTFQPRTIVRRVDFAQAMTRLLSQVAVLLPAEGARWANARGQFADIGPGHLAYPAASVAIAAGVMTPAEDNAFQPARPVTGAEAIASLERVRAMIATPGNRRR